MTENKVFRLRPKAEQDLANIYPVVSHVVFFKVSESGIIILRVLHRSMDYGRHLNFPI